MPGGVAVEVANKFRGLNRLLAPHILGPDQSPDCADCAAYKGRGGALGPRAGRKLLANFAGKVMGVIPFNINWRQSVLVATYGGVITPGNYPSGPSVAFCASAANFIANNGTGPEGPSGARVYFSFQYNGGVRGNPATNDGIGMVLDGASGGVGLVSGVNIGSTFQDGRGTFVNASPNCDLIEGFLGGGGASFTIYCTSTSGGSVLDFNITVMPTDSSVSIGVPGSLPKGTSLTFKQSNIASLGNPFAVT